MTAVEGRRVAAVSIAYAALTVTLAYPFSLVPGSTVVVDAPDTHLYLWTLAWDTHAFIHQPFRIFDANIYHPFANTLSYSENLIGSAFLAAPVIWITGNPVLAMNLVALLTCVLCGVGAYVLGRRVGLSPGAAFLCGMVFAFAPPRFFRMGQLHMTAVQWIPFALAYLHSYLDKGRPFDLRVGLAFFSLQALSSGHGAVFLTIAAAFVILYRIAFGEPLAFARRVRDFGVTGAYLIAPAVLVLLPYRAAQVEAGLRRTVEEEAVPTIESFVASPTWLHRHLHAAIGQPEINDRAIAFLFPGIIALVLVVLAVLLAQQQGAAISSIRHRWRKNPVPCYTALALICVWIFLPPPWGLWRFVYWWPGFNFIRVPSRFVILALLALSVTAGAGFDRLSLRLTTPRRTLATALVALFLAIEYAAVPFAAVPYRLEIPAIDRWLATAPRPFVFAEVPIASIGDVGTMERQQTRAMLHSMAHWQQTVHGYSGIRRPLHDQLFRELTLFPDDISIDRLRELGVTYVIVHSEQYPPGVWAGVERRLAERTDLSLVHVEEDGRAYMILPRERRDGRD